MKKKLSRVAVLAATLLLAGCITIKVDTDIRPDGSGVKSLIMAIDDDVMETAATGEPEATPENPFAELQKEAAGMPGVTVAEYHDEELGRSGVKMSVGFKNIDELPALSAEEPFKDLDSITIERDGSVYTLRATVNTGQISSDIAAEAGEEGDLDATPSPEELEMQEQILEAMDIEFTYSVMVPGKLLAYEPMDTATVEENRVTWQLALLEVEQADLMVQWDSKGKPSGPPPVQTPAAGTSLAPQSPGRTPPAQPPAQPSVQPTVTGSGKSLLSCTCCPLTGLLPIGMVASAALWHKRRVLLI